MYSLAALLAVPFSSAILVTVLQPKDTTSPVVLAKLNATGKSTTYFLSARRRLFNRQIYNIKSLMKLHLISGLLNVAQCWLRSLTLITILNAAASYNINPLLMFAITGQEQGFVPKSHKRAAEIANNPFNVYGSWQDFNTNIEDTAFIAARTIINLSKGCPPNADPIQFLNKKYAEDPKWHIGVTALLKQLEEVAG